MAMARSRSPWRPTLPTPGVDRSRSRGTRCPCSRPPVPMRLLPLPTQRARAAERGRPSLFLPRTGARGPRPATTLGSRSRPERVAMAMARSRSPWRSTRSTSGVDRSRSRGRRSPCSRPRAAYSRSVATTVSVPTDPRPGVTRTVRVTTSGPQCNWTASTCKLLDHDRFRGLTMSVPRMWTSPRRLTPGTPCVLGTTPGCGSAGNRGAAAVAAVLARPHVPPRVERWRAV